MSINADWEKFLGGPVRPSNEDAHITLSKGGVITFNRFVFGMIGKPEAVSLHFNRRERKIGLKAASPRFPEAFPVLAAGPRKNTRRICAASFCKHYGIKITETHKFTRPDLAADGMLVLDLNYTTVVSRVRNRDSRKA